MKFDPLTIYGLVSVLLMLSFYALEQRSQWCVLAFSASCVLASIYGFLQGAWPFGIVEGVWSIVALRRWWLRYKAEASLVGPRASAVGPLPNPFVDLGYSRQYLLDRLDEARPVIGTPIGFIAVCVVLEVLAKAANGTGVQNLGERQYVEFIRNWMPPQYSAFAYVSGVTDLPVQMYAVLRSGLVHGLSFVPLPGRNGRARSLWIEGLRTHASQGHLTQFTRPPDVPDACYFIGEEFLEDVASCTQNLFSTVDLNVQRNIANHFTDQPMIVM